MTYEHRIKPDWMHDCKFLDELKIGEIGYMMNGFFLSGNNIVVHQDELCSSVNRGTHNTMIMRTENGISLRDGNPITLGKIPDDTPYFKVTINGLTLEEKVNILWNQRNK